jgi:fatty-acyl-CoA synthase
VSDIAIDTPLKAWARALTLTANIARKPTSTLATQISELAEAYGRNVALIADDETLTYTELASRLHRFARWALEQGLTQGDVVCLAMQNCPTYLAAWLGITRVGAVVALVNTHLVGDSLAHAIRVASPKCIIVDADLAETVAAAVSTLEYRVPCWVFGAWRGSTLPWNSNSGRRCRRASARRRARAIPLYISIHPGRQACPRPHS